MNAVAAAVRLHLREGDRHRRSRSRSRSRHRVVRIDTTFAADLSEEGASVAAQDRCPGPDRRRPRPRSSGSTRPAGRRSGPRPRGSSTRRCARELRDTEVAADAASWPARWPATSTRRSGCSRPNSSARSLVANSTFSAELTNAAKAKAADEVEPVGVTIRQGEVIVRNGSPLTATDIEKIDALGLRQPTPRRGQLRRLVPARGPRWSGCCWPGSGASGRGSGIATTC